jgi:uncharacterized protein (TIRG00374 family)
VSRHPAIQYLVSLIILVVIFYNVGWFQTVNAVDAIVRSDYILFSIIGLIGYLLFRSYRWLLVVQALYPQVPLRQAVLSFLYGLGLGLITPGRLGEISRAVTLPAADKQFLGGFVIWEKVIDLLVLILIAGVGIGMLYGPLPLMVALLTVAGLIVLLKYLEKSERAISRIPSQTVRSYALKLRESIGYFDGKFLCYQVLLSFAVQSTLFIVYYFVLNAYEPVELWTIFIVQPIVMLSNALPLTAGGLGAREAASVLLYGKFGITSTAALSAPLIVYLFGDVLPALIGLVLSAVNNTVRTTTCSRNIQQ